MPLDIDRFIKTVIAQGGWELRYSPQHQPYAYLPEGFGNFEEGVRLNFMPTQEQVKVTGVIEHSDKLRIKRPSLYISTGSQPGAAAEYIKRSLIPRYQEAWYEAQPKIQEYMQYQAEREQATEELRRTLKLYQHLDTERGIEVLEGPGVEAILNHDLSVALKIQVPKELAVEILMLIKRHREENPPAQGRRKPTEE